MGNEAGSDPSPAPGEDEHAVAKALRAALRTNRHAEMAYDMAVAALGPSGYVHEQESKKGVIRTLYRRTAAGADALHPWPLLQISSVPQQFVDLDLGLPPVEVPPRPEAAPNLRGLHAGQVRLQDGPDALTVIYREDGLWKETIRSGPPETLEAVLSSLEGEGPSAPERVADVVAALEPARHGPGRVVVSGAWPGSPASAWRVGLSALRQALHERRIEEAPGWAAADGLDGTVCVHAASETEALEAWQHAAARRHRASQRWGTQPLADIPVVLVHFPACPLPARSWGEWVRALDDLGQSTFALRAADPTSMTLVHAALVDDLELESLPFRLDQADLDLPPAPTHAGEEWRGAPDWPCTTVSYALRKDPATGLRQLGWKSVNRSAEGAGSMMRDAGQLRDRIVRQRWH